MTLSAERPRLIVPGLLPADPSLERYRVQPGAVTAVELDPGDVLTVTDTEGRQRGELTVLAGGREDYGALGTAADTAATVLRALARPGAPRPARCGRPARARWRPAVGGGSRRGHRPAGGAGARPGADARGGAVRGVVARGHAGGVHRAAAADLRGGGARRADGRGRAQPALGPGDRGPAGDAAAAPRAAAAAAAGRPGARPAGGHRHRVLLRGGGGPVHPGHRRRGPPVLRLPGVSCAAARRGRRARPGRHHHPQPDGQRLPPARAVREVLRPGHAAAGGGGARHGRPARHVRAGLQRQVLRGHGLPGPCELHRQLQRPARAVRHSAAPRLAGAQLLLQHLLQRREPAGLRRAVVTARRLRPAAGHERPGVRLVRLPGRHRSGQRLEPDRHPRPRLPGRAEVLDGGSAPGHPGQRAQADQGDRIPPALVAADQAGDRVPRLLAADQLRQPRRDRRVLGLPRGRGGDGPVPAAQVRGGGAGRRGAAAGRGHPQRPQARHRPGGVHGHVQRDRRHARRRDDLPARPGHVPLRRRRRVRRDLAAPARRAAGARPGVDQALHRPAAQHRRAGPEVAGPAAGAGVDPGHPAGLRRPDLVPVRDRARRRRRRACR